jgi:hypothetical protein
MLMYHKQYTLHLTIDPQGTSYQLTRSGALQACIDQLLHEKLETLMKKIILCCPLAYSK